MTQVMDEVLHIGLKFNTFPSDKFLNLLLRMVPIAYEKSQKDRKFFFKVAFSKMDSQGRAQTVSNRSERHVGYQFLSTVFSWQNGSSTLKL